jgi:hypothetical protein
VALRPLLAKGLPFRRFRHRHRTAEVLHGCHYEWGIPDRAVTMSGGFPIAEL